MNQEVSKTGTEYIMKQDFLLNFFRIARRERDEGRRDNELLQRERDEAMMRRDMALKSAEAHFNERKELEQELSKVENAYVSRALEHLKAELSCSNSSSLCCDSRSIIWSLILGSSLIWSLHCSNVKFKLPNPPKYC